MCAHVSRKQNEPEIGDMIRHHGGDWHKFTDRQYAQGTVHCPHCHRPHFAKILAWKTDLLPYDGEATFHGVKAPIEIKQPSNGMLSFAFSDVRPNQHAGLSDWQQRHGHPAWFALTMGHDRAGSRTTAHPRRTWLPPWDFWLGVEREILGLGFKSIPYSPDCTRRVLKEHTAVDLLAQYEVHWSHWPDGSGWAIPRTHEFASMYGPIFFPAAVNEQPRRSEELCYA